MLLNMWPSWLRKWMKICTTRKCSCLAFHPYTVFLWLHKLKLHGRRRSGQIELGKLVKTQSRYISTNDFIVVVFSRRIPFLLTTAGVFLCALSASHSRLACLIWRRSRRRVLRFRPRHVRFFPWWERFVLRQRGLRGPRTPVMDSPSSSKRIATTKARQNATSRRFAFIVKRIRLPLFRRSDHFGAKISSDWNFRCVDLELAATACHWTNRTSFS